MQALSQSLFADQPDDGSVSAMDLDNSYEEEKGEAVRLTKEPVEQVVNDQDPPAE